MQKKIALLLFGLLAPLGALAACTPHANTFPTLLNGWATSDCISSLWANSLEAKIGINGSAVQSTLDYKINHATSSLGTAAYRPLTDFLASSTQFVANNLGNWLGTWQGVNSSSFVLTGALGTAAYRPLTDFLSSSTQFVATTTGNWAGNWHSYTPSTLPYLSTSTGLTSANMATSAISQWANDKNFATTTIAACLAAVTSTNPITYNQTTGALGWTNSLGYGTSNVATGTSNTWNGTQTFATTVVNSETATTTVVLSSLTFPISAGATPTASGTIAFDSSSSTTKLGGTGGKTGVIPRTLIVIENLMTTDVVTSSQASNTEKFFNTSTTLPAGFLAPGKVVRVTTGWRDTCSASPPNESKRFYLSVASTTTPLVTLGPNADTACAASGKNKGYTFDMFALNGPAVNASVTVVALSSGGNNAYDLLGDSATTPISVDTTATTTLHWTEKWATNKAANSSTLIYLNVSEIW